MIKQDMLWPRKVIMESKVFYSKERWSMAKKGMTWQRRG